MDHSIVIFADGASSGNPGPGGWGSIIATPDGRIVELGGFQEAATNNQMELTAVIRALEQITSEASPVLIYTDSVYVIRGITQWIWGWQRKGWKTAEGAIVANQDLWKRLVAVVTRCKARGTTLDWRYVRGHSGIPGNERCDEIAVSYSRGQLPRLYSGPLLKYPVAVYDVPENTELPTYTPKDSPKTPPYSYLSLVGTIPQRHKTWAECERRVKGQSGAKFKKAMTPEDEIEILRGWGYTLEHLRTQ